MLEWSKAEVVERFFGTLESEYLEYFYLQKLASLAEVRRIEEEYIHYVNHQAKA